MNLKSAKNKLIQYALLSLTFSVIATGVFALPPDSLKVLTYTTKSGARKKVETAAEWPKKREQILAGMQAAMGPLPSMKNLPPFAVKVLDSLDEGNHMRYTIRFTVAEGEELPALIYVPKQTGKPKRLPAMLVLHGTTENGKHSVSGNVPKPNRAQAREIADRGYVVIAPDYPSFGDLKSYNFETDRYQSGTMKGIFDHIRCIDLLQTRADVDPERIGVLGHSLGGHNSMFVSAFDTRIKVTVSSCGWTLFDYYNIGEKSALYGGKLGPWAQTRYMPLVRDVFKLDAAKMPFDFDEVIAAIAPRAFFSNSPLSDANFDVKGVKKGISYVTPVYSLLSAKNNLQVRYPQAEHDFPVETRQEAYQFIDKILKHKPWSTTLQP